MKKVDLLIVFGFFIMLVAASVFIQYKLQQQTSECIQNPLMFGAKQISEETGYEFNGYGFVTGLPIGKRSPIISFNSTSMTVE